MQAGDVLPKPGKRLALFFDGTWNIPESNTNVWRLFLMLGECASDGLTQKGYYDEGVGTVWRDRFSGGAFGAGLSENIRAGYRWLMQNYNHGDEIYLFGFSRGAFTARSLAGMISRCGLLKPDAPMSFWDIYERYRKGDSVRSIDKLKILQQQGETNFDFEEKVLLHNAWFHRNLIKMVGVWDTVGSIGVPFKSRNSISHRTLQFHNTHLSIVVEHSYQALAIDEYRKPYWAILWTHFVPDLPNLDEAGQYNDHFVEQRWFSGAHANVGGGYKRDLLPQRPLAWIQDKAIGCGLGFRERISINDDDYFIKPRDSYSEFLCGLWRPLTRNKRYVRWIQSDPVKKNGGWVETVNERIDYSVFRRCRLDRSYRPLSLIEWAERKCYNMEQIIKSPDQYSHLWIPRTKSGIESSIGNHNQVTSTTEQTSVIVS